MRTFHFTSDALEEPPLNLTSLIDVVFIILITFIVIAPLLNVDQVALAPGKGATEEVQRLGQSSLITIHVHQDNSILLNDTQSSLTLLPAQLQALYRSHPESIPQLFQDREAYFGTYQGIKQAVEEAGFSKLDVILEPQG